MIDNSPHRTPPLNYNTNTKCTIHLPGIVAHFVGQNGEFSKQKYILVQSSNHGCEHTNSKEVVNSQSSQ